MHAERFCFQAVDSVQRRVCVRAEVDESFEMLCVRLACGMESGVQLWLNVAVMINMRKTKV